MLHDDKDSNAAAANRVVLAVGLNSVIMIGLALFDWFVMR